MWTKRLIKVFSDGSAIWREWRMTGSWECAGSHSVGRLRKRGIDTVKDGLKKRLWMSGKQGLWCMIRMYG